MPMSEAALRRALERIGAAAPVRFDEVTRSTNATALELAADGAPEWTLVAAGHQTAGRGRLGRVWEDEAGSALLFSLVLRPDLVPEQGGLIPLLAGSTMARACRAVAGSEVGCTWPNDLLLDGRKVGGILTESVTEGATFACVVLGIGVNLTRAPEVEGAGKLGEVDPAGLLEAFLERFAHHYEPGHPAFAGAVAHDYREVCVTLGRRVRATTVEGVRVEGDAVDVDEDGALVIRTPGGLEGVRFGEVEHLDEGSLPR
jgi:BirA family transcriptional regulator, biotin operon repressor / biotin---[acetyl-CoA-carboxylase] ligase